MQSITSLSQLIPILMNFYILYFHYKRTKIKSHKLYQQKIQNHINCVHIKN